MDKGFWVTVPVGPERIATKGSRVSMVSKQGLEHPSVRIKQPLLLFCPELESDVFVCTSRGGGPSASRDVKRRGAREASSSQSTASP